MTNADECFRRVDYDLSGRQHGGSYSVGLTAFELAAISGINQRDGNILLIGNPLVDDVVAWLVFPFAGNPRGFDPYIAVFKKGVS